MSEFTQHWVTDISARRHNYEGAPLTFRLKTEFSQLPSEITLYLHSDELTTALVEAINATVGRHKKPAPAETEDAT